MPLFTEELNRRANGIRGTVAWTIWLHTAAPTDALPDNGLVTAGGGAFQAGATLAVADITMASNGDIRNDTEVDFGTATATVGSIIYWSAKRGAENVAYGPLPNTQVNVGDSFAIPARALRLNGSTS